MSDMTSSDGAIGACAKRINSYISQFTTAVAEATGMELDFDLLDAEGFTTVTRGSATVGISVIEEEETIVFASKIMDVPATQQEACYRMLLELNYAATSVGAFAIDKESDSIVLKAHRSIEGLDYDEFEEMLDSVATVADEWDDRLQEMFA
jgi:hypothetical protein